jgi:nicotinamide-nucleotide amidase
MKSLIISIGDELLIGQVVNTNAAFIARGLNSIGIEVHQTLTIGDNLEDIVAAIGHGVSKYFLTIITGGLGPTHDDITKKALCRYLQTDLVANPEAKNNIEQYLQHRSFSWSPVAEEQSMIPDGTTIIPNLRGTASGLLFERSGKYCVVMPGVPHEMEAMMTNWVLPFFGHKTEGNVIIHRTLKTTGIAESLLAQMIGDVRTFLGESSLAFLPSPSGVRLRITASGRDKGTVEQTIRRIEYHIRSKVERYIYGVDEEQLEEVLGQLLTQRKLRIAVAESCTGGLVADKVTNVPGSSTYFQCGLVAYSNKSKVELLDVPEILITRHGAVSAEVAEAMALGIRKKSSADIGISTTGIAGPTGGTSEKPEGLVWIGYSDTSSTTSTRFLFGSGRSLVKERASQAALDLVRRKILDIE